MKNVAAKNEASITVKIFLDFSLINILLPVYDHVFCDAHHILLFIDYMIMNIKTRLVILWE